ncbi:hypothetical protein VP01_779g9 [Puccinia sorghi]|uniref:Uncharacterized protein n=1 Tax=Puccinia sorghi TaxID=27349 RepID=A0A0L6UC26_9BASI|nr:hypothetical protein VP01_779g9 [Puccinia sorghi]
MKSINPPKKLGKTQVARDGLRFEMLKFERRSKMMTRGLNWRRKNFNHTWALEEKKWNHGINMEENKLDWEKEEKEKDRSFEMAKLEQLASQEHIGQ